MLQTLSRPFILPILGLLLLASPIRHEVPKHPQDGPDVDLRVRIDRDRVEIATIVNLAFADEIAPVPRRQEDFAASDELAAIRRALEAAFARELRLSIDDRPREPDRRDFEELPWEPDDAEYFPRMGLRAVQKFRLGAVYRLEEPPRRVGLVWGLYPPDLALAGLVDQKIAIKAEWSAGRDLAIVDLSEDEPEYIWHAPPGAFERPSIRTAETPVAGATWTQRLVSVLVLVLIALLVVLAGGRGRAGLVAPVAAALVVGLLLPSLGTSSGPVELDDDEAGALFLDRLRGIYEAFSFSDESDIYDALATCVSDRMIEPVYDEVYESLLMREQGGAVGRVRELSPITTEVVERSEDGAEIGIEARWQVDGEVYHWGHTHGRRNVYHARYGLARTPRGWLIDSSRTLSQERIELEDGP